MTIEELQVLITANTTALQKEIAKTNTVVNSLKKSADKTQSGVTSAFKKLKSGIVALGIGKIIKDSIQSGMDAVESDSLFETSLGDMADSVRSWSDEVSDALGLNAITMRKNTGVIYNMTSSMGVAEENALKMSKGISLLTEDMASFYNLDSTEAFNKLRAGLTGETEPLKALGILVDENTIKQVAYSEGIATTGSELTQQQKVLARYVAILKQTGNAQGDLARTLDSPANQLRLLKSQVQQLGLAFSDFLLPVVSAILPYLTAFTKVVTSALNSLSKFLGLKSTSATSETSKVSANVGSIADGLDDANSSAKSLKNTLAGFDEMNVLSDSSTSDSSSTGTSVGGIDFDLSEYDAHLDWVSSKTDDIAERIKSAFSGIKIGDNLVNSFKKLETALEPFTATIFDGLNWAWNNLLIPLANYSINDLIPSFINLLSGALDFLSPIISDFKELFTWMWDKFLEPVASWTGGVIVDVLNGIADALSWIGQNELAVSIIEGFGIALGVVAGALALWNIAVGVWNGIGAIATVITSGFAGAMALLTSPITIAVLAIGALVTAIILLVKNWDTVKETAINVWNKIKEIWGTVSDWFKTNIIEPISNFFSGMWDGLKTGAKNAWDGIKSVFSSVATFFKNIFSTAWTAVKNVFSVGGKIFDGIKDGIVSAFKNIVNGIITGINKVVSVPFNSINKVLNKIKNISIAGIKPFDWMWTLTVPQIPKLAQGGVVNKPTYAMIGEAGAEAVMPLENNTGWIDKLADKLGSKMGGTEDTSIRLTVKIGEDTIMDKVIKGIKDKEFETNGVVFV